MGFFNCDYYFGILVSHRIREISITLAYRFNINMYGIVMAGSWTNLLQIQIMGLPVASYSKFYSTLGILANFNYHGTRRVKDLFALGIFFGSGSSNNPDHAAIWNNSFLTKRILAILAKTSITTGPEGPAIC